MTILRRLALAVRTAEVNYWRRRSRRSLARRGIKVRPVNVYVKQDEED